MKRVILLIALLIMVGGSNCWAFNMINYTLNETKEELMEQTLKNGFVMVGYVNDEKGELLVFKNKNTKILFNITEQAYYIYENGPYTLFTDKQKEYSQYIKDNGTTYIDDNGDPVIFFFYNDKECGVSYDMEKNQVFSFIRLTKD